MEIVRVIGGVVAALALAWALLLTFLLIVRPHDISFGEAKRFVSDVVRLLTDLSRDPSVSRKVRRRLGLLLVYLASPIDLVPDFVPVLGYADDVILIAYVLRSVVRQAGADTVERHWRGSSEGLTVLHRLAGIPSSPNE